MIRWCEWETISHNEQIQAEWQSLQSAKVDAVKSSVPIIWMDSFDKLWQRSVRDGLETVKTVGQNSSDTETERKAVLKQRKSAGKFSKLLKNQPYSQRFVYNVQFKPKMKIMKQGSRSN